MGSRRHCRYQIILIGDIKELLQKLDTFCFNDQHTWTAYINFSSTGSETKLLSIADKCFILCRQQSTLINETEMWTECAASRKRDFSKKNTKHLLSSFQTTKSTQTSGLINAERIEPVKMLNSR